MLDLEKQDRREVFALVAMHGLLAGRASLSIGNADYTNVAELSVMAADRLIERLDADKVLKDSDHDCTTAIEATDAER